MADGARAAEGGRVPSRNLSQPQPVTVEACREDLARTLDAGELDWSGCL